jgi:phosphate transport system permease protein
MSTITPQHIRSLNRQKMSETIFMVLVWLCILLALFTFLTLFTDLISKGWSKINPDFFTNFPSRRAERAGIYSAWVGSALVMLVTFCTGVPLGVAAGIYLEEYAKKNWLNDVIEINISNLAGIPSIVYGLLALGLFVQQFSLGQSILSAGLTLGLLILPIVIVATREAIRTIPNTIREASYALGSTRWQMIWFHILRYASPGILTGVIIGLARAIGETAPLITIGALTSLPSYHPCLLPRLMEHRPLDCLIG